MTGPIPLPIALSPSAVSQTLMRVGSAAHYVVSCDPSMIPAAAASQWRRLILGGNADGLTENISLYGVAPYAHLEEVSRESLKQLVVAHPRLHAAFEEGAGRIERSIGADLPLILPVFASFASFETPLRLPKVGMDLFLDRFPEQVPDIYSGLQIFHLTPEASVPSTIPISHFKKRFRKTTSRVDDDPVAKAIADLAQRDLDSLRVTPLSSGDVALRSKVAHVGRFSFLGFDDLPRSHLGILQMFSRWSPVIDVLVLGSYFATRETEARRFIKEIRPRIVLMRTEGPSELLAEDGDLMIARLNPRESVRSFLELDPKTEILSITVGNKKTHFHAHKRDRWQTLLNARESGVLRGATEGDGFTMNRVLKYATSYLYLLESSPNLHGRTGEKAENLRRLIDEMILGQRDPQDHIRFFSEILLASGVLV